jgi:hypothetical protein
MPLHTKDHDKIMGWADQHGWEVIERDPLIMRKQGRTLQIDVNMAGVPNAVRWMGGSEHTTLGGGSTSLTRIEKWMATEIQENPEDEEEQPPADDQNLPLGESVPSVPSHPLDEVPDSPIPEKVPPLVQPQPIGQQAVIDEGTPQVPLQNENEENIPAKKAAAKKTPTKAAASKKKETASAPNQEASGTVPDPIDPV